MKLNGQMEVDWEHPKISNVSIFSSDKKNFCFECSDATNQVYIEVAESTNVSLVETFQKQVWFMNKAQMAKPWLRSKT